MEASKVYFTNLRTEFDQSLPKKLTALIKKAGISKIDFADKFTAIKLHFGEPGNLAFLRPNYAKALADEIKSLGGKPFLTDCNTLYVGGRKNAVDHLAAAGENGFNQVSTGCQILIADGLYGNDERLIPINGDYVQNAKIGAAIAEADIIVSLSHFKGHEQTGMGGALKNLGMGCGSCEGKKEMHNAGRPTAMKETCIGCMTCEKSCAHAAISFDDNGKAGIDHAKCVGCGRCVGVCPVDAIVPDDGSNDALCKKIAEYAAAVIKGKQHFHICIITDVSPYCDCHGENDMPLIPNLGMLASFDPVALDMACADLCNKAPVLPGSALDGVDTHGDLFAAMHPQTNYMAQLDQGEKMGIGQKNYELISID